MYTKSAVQNRDIIVDALFKSAFLYSCTDAGRPEPRIENEDHPLLQTPYIMI